MEWFINGFGLFFGVGIAIVLVAFLTMAFIGAALSYTDKKFTEKELNQSGSKNVHINGNCSVVQSDGVTILKNDKYTICITNNGITINNKKVNLDEFDSNRTE